MAPSSVLAPLHLPIWNPSLVEPIEGLCCLARMSVKQGWETVMSYEIDRELKRLARDGIPAGLDLIEQSVLDRVAGHRFASPETLFRVGLVAGAVALAMGIFGGVLPVQPAPPADSLTPLLETSRLAPSSLLVERQ